MKKFEVSPEDCLLALEFRDASSLREIARRMDCDPSSLLRKVQRVSKEHGLLEKIKGRWVLTAKGHVLNRWTEDSLISQQKTLETQTQLRLGTTTWLAEQIVVPFYAHLKKESDQNAKWVIVTPKRSFENEILEGLCDYVLTCKIPVDPAIAYKKVALEDWIVIAPPSWQKQIRDIGEEKVLSFLSKKELIQHVNLNAFEMLGLKSSGTPHIAFDNLISIRAAVIAGYGWSFVPKLSVLKELRQGTLIEVPITWVKLPPPGHLCLWWSRTRKEPRALASKVQTWISNALLECRDSFPE